jgi:acyl-CoA synthetase (AMP-forming)/AMP-acid ligase II
MDPSETLRIDIARELAGNEDIATLGSAARTTLQGMEAIGRIIQKGGGSVPIPFDYVLNSPDPDRGASVKAFVRCKPGIAAGDALAHELQEHVKRITAPYKYPREIEFVDDLPKTVSGKIRRVELRRLEERRKNRPA